MGLIDVWGRLAAHAPQVVNYLAQTPPFATLLKAAVGLAPERELPQFASLTFKEWFRTRGSVGGEESVILWPDTFTNHFHPGVGRAAVEVLESAGFRVRVPPGPVCCGRPLYDFGMLGRARRYLRRVLDVLAGDLQAGTPVVVLEPSCLAVFKDELGNLFPDDEDAQRLRDQSMLLSQLLVERAHGWQPPRLGGRALVHGHCHQRALVGTEDDEKLLRQLGVEFEDPNAGCCGLAGSFGYERGERYDVSMKAGERVLLPSVRAAPTDALVVASGFSCRQQIGQATDRRALHLAQVVQMALRGGAGGDYPERDYAPAEARRRSAAPVLLAGAGLAVGAVLLRQLNTSRY